MDFLKKILTPQISSEIASLRTFMLEDLKKSGISSEAANQFKFRPVTKSDAEKILGFPLPETAGGGYSIPFHDPGTGVALSFDSGDVQRIFERIRFEKPVQLDPSGKPAKYLSPKGGGIHAFILPEVHKLLISEPDQPLLMTEGEKKSIAALQKGVHAVGICGIWGWITGGGNKELNPEIARYMSPKRDVIMIFDSDSRELRKKADFDACAESLAAALMPYDSGLFRLDMPGLEVKND